MGIERNGVVEVLIAGLATAGAASLLIYMDKQIKNPKTRGMIAGGATLATMLFAIITKNPNLRAALIGASVTSSLSLASIIQQYINWKRARGETIAFMNGAGNGDVKTADSLPSLTA